MISSMTSTLLVQKGGFNGDFPQRRQLLKGGDPKAFKNRGVQNG